MITSTILYVIFFTISLLTALLPDGFTLPAIVTTAFTYVFSAFGKIPFLPTAAQIAPLLTAAFYFAAGILLWYLFGWLLKKIPGVS